MSSSEFIPTTTEPYEPHVAAMEFIGKMAKSVFGVEFSERTMENWTTAIVLVREVDDIFDQADEQSKTDMRQKLSNISNSKDNGEFLINDRTTTLAKQLRGRLSDHQAQVLFNRGIQIVDLQEELKRETDLDKYAESTILEGQMLTTMFLYVVEPEDKAQPGYPEFVDFFLDASGVANLLDSSSDLKEDYDDGITSIEPTLANNLRLKYATRFLLAKTVPKLTPLQMAGFLRPAYEIARDRKA